jgi:hypothetical protein
MVLAIAIVDCCIQGEIVLAIEVPKPALWKHLMAAESGFRS